MDLQGVGTSESLIMVDVMGRIVFINQQSQLLKYMFGTDKEITGEPFFEVFNITFDQYKVITEQTTTSNTPSVGTIKLLNDDQKTVNMNYKAISQLDNYNTLLGYDILLSVAMETAPELVEVDIALQSDILPEFVCNLVEKLEYLLTRVGGKYLSNHFELIINNTINLNEWDMSFNNSKLIIGADIPTVAFEAVIARGILFANKVVGKTMTQNVVNQARLQLSADDLVAVSELKIDRYFMF